jgi:hypothetical protein
MPKQCEHLQLALKLEYNNLLQWAKIAGLLEDEEAADGGTSKIATIIGADQVILVAVLSEIRTLLEDFAALNGKYIELQPEDDLKAEKTAAGIDVVEFIGSVSIKSETTKADRRMISGLKSIMGTSKDILKIAKHPRRIKWAALDEPAFNKLLLKLRDLTNYLHSLLDAHQSQILRETTRKTYLELLHVSGKVDDLKDLVLAAGILTARSQHPNPHPSAHQNEGMLAALAQCKSLREVVESPSYKHTRAETRLPVSTIKYDPCPSPTPLSGDFDRSYGTYTANGHTSRIWIEWKKYTLEYFKDDMTAVNSTGAHPTMKVNPQTLTRVQGLATLLKSPKPSMLSTPHCLGYFDDREASKGNPSRFGLVYLIPSGLSPPIIPVSLHTLILTAAKPSLTARIALAHRLATALLYLHAANWLHKDLRSANILFFPPSPSPNPSQSASLSSPSNQPPTYLLSPLLSGFAYSRPDTPSENTTTYPTLIPSHELRRHPSAQGLSPQKARKSHDIYALGIIMLELVLWEPLEEVLGFGGEEMRGAGWGSEMVRGVGGRLLHGEGTGTAGKGVGRGTGGLERVRGDAGEMVWGAVRACLEGCGTEVDVDVDEESVEGGRRLFRGYIEKVVEALEAVVL